MNEQEIVKQSLLEIFKKNGYVDTNLMTQRHFEHIGNEIEKKSGILISGTTIRRLSNGEFSRMPQIATLNAIATYLDFKNWQDYKLSLQPVKKETGAMAEAMTLKKRSRGSPYVGLGLLVVTISIIAYYLYPTKSRSWHVEKVTFSAHKNTTNDLPNTVVFNYNVDDVVADSFFIQQSWDKNRRIKIDKNNHTVTDIYYEPGYHIAKLIANDSIIKAVDVSIPTDKWFFYANEYKARYKTEYIKTDNFVKNGSLALSRDDLLKNNVEIDENKLYLYSYFPSQLEVSSDNYILKTRARMKEIRNNLCPYIALEVYCQKFFMVIKSTPKGCASEAALLFAEKAFGGKQNDLAAIAYDVTQWNDVELLVKNKHVLLKINGKECFSTDYLNSGELITGLSFISNGLCEVDKVELTGLDGKVVYKNEFNEK
jgi:hypothetical protein